MSFVRKKNRLADKKLYEENNAYFVTICAFERQYIFGDKNCVLNQYGEIVQEVWLNLPILFENIVLDEFVIMPNHFHGIITFLDTPISKFTNKKTSLSKIVKFFKAKVSIEIKQKNASKHDELKFVATNENPVVAENLDFPLCNNKIWQKSFYDHIIRNEQDMKKIREYIQNNTQSWSEDILNKENQDKYDLWIKKNK